MFDPKAYYQKNKEKIKARKNKWYQEHKEYAKERERKRHHLKYMHKGYAAGERNGFWKGDEVGYHGLHKWLYRNKKRLDYCELCKKTGVKFNWASKSREYRRDLNDWLNLCVKCHWYYDKQHERKRDWHGRLM